MNHSRAPNGGLPSITIITPCLNGEPYVVEAIESLERQRYPGLQHLLLDGGSTDNTLAIAGRYAHLTVLSERDGSAHHAMNKGLTLAQGEVIGFLNADDFYPDGVLAEVGRLFAETPDVDIVAGQTVWFEQDAFANRVLRKRIHDDGDKIWLAGVAFRAPGFNGCFFRRTVFERIGVFETKYDFSADTHFLLRCALAGLRVAWIRKPTIWYRQHRDSRTFNPERRSLILVYAELFEMAAEFAGRCKSSDLKSFFLAWQAFIGFQLVLRSFLRGQVAGSVRAAIKLTLRNPLWPVRLIEAMRLRQKAKELVRRPPEHRSF
jgi:glycosyltransferase involved in cell wall biosynthesis